jgi:O-6-methylguanine DNA methyltransferase
MTRSIDVPDTRLAIILAGRFDETMSFRERAWAVCCRIPAGKVATYAAVAEVIHPGRGRHFARAVGQAMRTNPHAPQVPCHRVVASDRTLTGYSAPGGLSQKQQILQSEGVAFDSTQPSQHQRARISTKSLVDIHQIRTSI